MDPNLLMVIVSVALVFTAINSTIESKKRKNHFRSEEPKLSIGGIMSVHELAHWVGRKDRQHFAIVSGAVSKVYTDINGEKRYIPIPSAAIDELKVMIGVHCDEFPHYAQLMELHHGQGHLE